MVQLVGDWDMNGISKQVNSRFSLPNELGLCTGRAVVRHAIIGPFFREHIEHRQAVIVTDENEAVCE